jgi:hypothetical protein
MARVKACQPHFQKPTDPPFLLASILHGGVLLLLGWATI